MDLWRLRPERQPPPAPAQSEELMEQPEIIRAWQEQLRDPALWELVLRYGQRRLDVTLRSDRGKVTKPPKLEVE